MNAPTRIIPIRASSLGELFDCPARWEAKHVMGMRMPSGAAAMLGKAIHASTAMFDSSVLAGKGLTADETAGAAVDAIHKPTEDVDWDEDDPNTAESIAVSLHKRYCKDESPKHDFAAVEVKCESLTVSDLGIALTGTTDRVERFDDPAGMGFGFGIGDLKSGKSAVSADGTVNTKGHAFQIGVYELMAERASGLSITAPAQIIGFQTGKTEKGQRIGVGKIIGARDVLVGDGDSPGVLEIAARIVHSGVFAGNPRSMLCHARYCPAYATCKFRR